MSTAYSSSPATVLLHGRLHNLRRTRQSHDFVFTDTDRSKIGATAVAAGLAGLGGIATGLSGMAIDTSDVADLLEFDLDGKAVKAWVWISVFNEGDEVEVVAELEGDCWQGYGIRRIADSVVALHPHCSRGRYAHYKASAKWCAGITSILYVVTALIFIVMGLLDSGFEYMNNYITVLMISAPLAFLVCGFVAFRMARKLMGFVKLAEGIFSAFGWKNVKSIDLPAITKKGKKPGEPAALGIMYFRYSKDTMGQLG